jgi:rhodanese-related sulfurtransferase
MTGDAWHHMKTPSQYANFIQVSEPAVWTPAQLLAAIDAGSAPLVIDVRSRREFKRGHVPTAVHVPFWLLPARLHGVRDSRDVPVVVYCGHGPRAWFARAVLLSNGFKHVALLEGHMARWKREGLRRER